jgi:hypothetical protein
MLERIDLDLLYLLYDTKYFQDRRLASIADKIETASMCIAMAVEALRAVGSEEPGASAA